MSARAAVVAALLLLLLAKSTLTFRTNGNSPGCSTREMGLCSSSASAFYDMDGCMVLLPVDKVPKSIVHFVGGFLAGSNRALPIAYTVLSQLAQNGHLVVATPIPAIELNHKKVAEDIARAFTICYSNSLLPIIGPAGKDVPIIGLSHSLGGKLTVLMGSDKAARKVVPRRQSNIFLAFNNFGITDSLSSSLTETSRLTPEIRNVIESVNLPKVKGLIDSVRNIDLGESSKAISATKSMLENLVGANAVNTFGDALTKQFGRIDQIVNDVSKFSMSDVEFNPSPAETWSLLQQGYNIQSNYVMKFADDEIDQSFVLAKYLRERGCDVKYVVLEGNHLTPNTIFDETGDVEAPMDKKYYDTTTYQIKKTPALDSIEDMLEEQGRAFSDELVKTLNRISQDFLDEVTRKEQEQYRLPSGKRGSSGQWDSDDF